MIKCWFGLILQVYNYCSIDLVIGMGRRSSYTIMLVEFARLKIFTN